MATYDYKCSQCSTIKEVVHGMNESPEILCGCGIRMERIISGVSFVLKGDGWTGKNIKAKNEKMRRRREVGKKMAQNHDIPQIVPNYKGEICKSWEETKMLAKNDGIDSLQYEKQIQDFKCTQEKTKEKVSKLLKGDA